MKIALFCLLTLLAIPGLIAQSGDGLVFSGEGEGEPSLLLNQGSFEFYPFLGGFPEFLEGSYRVVTENRVPFLELRSPQPRRLVFLSSRYFCALSSVDDQVETGLLATQYTDEIADFPPSKEGIRYLSRHYQVRASSYLREKHRSYGPDNLKASASLGPWAEGVPGPGIGETLSFDFSGSENPLVDGLVISNGYVSGKDSSLFLKNNRLHEIEISSQNPSFNLVVSLNDDPNIQLINLPRPSGQVTLKIKSVYPGSAYDDSCLNFVLGIKGLK